MAARISEFSYTKNLESDFFFIKNPNLTKKIMAVGRDGGGDVARVSVFFCFFFFLFSKESKSEGVKVREDWLV